MYGLVQIMGGRDLKAYFFQEGYLRTSSREFSIADLDNKYVHLTNDAIQKKAADYGKYETGNKISFEGVSNYSLYLRQNFLVKVSVFLFK